MNGLVKEIPLETLTACPTFSFILAVSKRNPDHPQPVHYKEEKKAGGLERYEREKDKEKERDKRKYDERE